MVGRAPRGKVKAGKPGAASGAASKLGRDELKAISMKKAQGMGFIIPTPVVRRFLAVYEATGTFGRLPSLGLHMQCLNNSAMRALLFGLGEQGSAPHNGLLITKVLRHSCAEAAGVRPGDLLVAIDGEAISEEGEVTFRGHERVEYEYLVTRKQCGESLVLSVLRSAHGATTPQGSFDLNALATSPSKPAPLELPVTLAPTHELCPREL